MIAIFLIATCFLTVKAQWVETASAPISSSYYSESYPTAYYPESYSPSPSVADAYPVSFPVASLSLTPTPTLDCGGCSSCQGPLCQTNTGGLRGLQTSGSGGMIWTVENIVSIEMSMGADLPYLSFGGSVKFDAKKKIEFGIDWGDEGDEPLIEENPDGICVLCKEMTVTCARKCTVSTTDTAKGNVKMWFTSVEGKQVGTRAAHKKVTHTMTVPAGTPLGNLEEMCRDELNALATGGTDDVCDAAELAFKTFNEWNFLPNCGNAADGDAWCEAQPEFPSVDAWTNSRCQLSVPASGKTEDHFGYCKAWSIKGGDCPGTDSCGLFEYPCDTGLTCRVVRPPTYWPITGWLWGCGNYKCF